MSRRWPLETAAGGLLFTDAAPGSSAAVNQASTRKALALSAAIGLFLTALRRGVNTTLYEHMGRLLKTLERL